MVVAQLDVHSQPDIESARSFLARMWTCTHLIGKNLKIIRMAGSCECSSLTRGRKASLLFRQLDDHIQLATLSFDLH